LKGKAVFEPAVYWLQALLELAIMARSKIEDEDDDDWSIALS
jgi:hypothetical protein